MVLGLIQQTIKVDTQIKQKENLVKSFRFKNKVKILICYRFLMFEDNIKTILNRKHLFLK